jgi:hypothetical protein
LERVRGLAILRRSDMSEVVLDLLEALHSAGVRVGRGERRPTRGGCSVSSPGRASATLHRSRRGHGRDDGARGHLRGVRGIARSESTRRPQHDQVGARLRTADWFRRCDRHRDHHGARRCSRSAKGVARRPARDRVHQRVARPLPLHPFVPPGGIAVEEVPAGIEAGAIYIGLGAALVRSDGVDRRLGDELRGLT